MSDKRQYILRGNIFLLRQPYLFRVKTSRRFSAEEASSAMSGWRCNLFNGGIPVSPFIHPHEKELRDYAIEERFSYIRVCANGFAEREAASGREFELMAEGRLLLVGQYHYNTRKEDLRYSYAQTLNALSAEIADFCNRGFRFAIRPIN